MDSIGSVRTNGHPTDVSRAGLNGRKLARAKNPRKQNGGGRMFRYQWIVAWRLLRGKTRAVNRRLTPLRSGQLCVASRELLANQQVVLHQTSEFTALHESESQQGLISGVENPLKCDKNF